MTARDIQRATKRAGIAIESLHMQLQGQRVKADYRLVVGAESFASSASWPGRIEFKDEALRVLCMELSCAYFDFEAGGRGRTLLAVLGEGAEDVCDGATELLERRGW